MEILAVIILIIFYAIFIKWIYNNLKNSKTDSNPFLSAIDDWLDGKREK